MCRRLLWWAIAFTISSRAFTAAGQSPGWQGESSAAFEAFRAGDYSRAVVLYRSTLQTARAESISCDSTQQARSNLAVLYAALQRYEEAKHVIVDGIENECKGYGASEGALTWQASALGEVYRAERKYGESEEAFQSALKMAESLYGNQHPQVAIVLSNLGQLYVDEHRVAAAEPLLGRAVSIFEKSANVDHHLASAFNELAQCYLLDKQYAKAQPLLIRSLSIYERTLGPEHPYLAAPLSNLGFIYNATQQYASAIQVLERALSILEKSLGSTHPQAANILDILAASFWGQHEADKADLCLRRALSIARRDNVADFDRVRYLHDLADLDQMRHSYKEAEGLYRECLQALSHFDCNPVLREEITEDLAALLRNTKRSSEIDDLESHHPCAIPMPRQAAGIARK